MARKGRQNMRAKSVLEAGRLRNRQNNGRGGNNAYFTHKDAGAGFRQTKNKTTR